MPSAKFYITSLEGNVKHDKLKETNSLFNPLRQSVTAEITLQLKGDGNFSDYCDEEGNIKDGKVLEAIFKGGITIAPYKF